MLDFLNLPDISFWGNTLNNYILALIAVVGLLIVFWIIFVIVMGALSRFSKKTKTDIDDTLVKIVRSIRPPLYVFVAVYVALQFLYLHPVLDKTLTVIFLIWIVYQVIVIAQILIEYIVYKKIGVDEEADDKARGAADLLNLIVKIVLWSFGLLLILSNLGVNVTSLIAGLGIGGIAIAFALQNILSDLFSSFSIYFDKPFEVGDFIIVGDKLGVVEKIGIKTTRITALQGEELVLSNAKLTSSDIQNFKQMQERRKSFTFGVTYGTSPEKLEKINEHVKTIIENTPNTRFDRVHFFEFGSSSLNFEVVYYVLSPDYVEYMDAHQKIHLEIMKALQKEGIEFAFPTQTIHIEK